MKIENLNLVELNTQEVSTIDGGYYPPIGVSPGAVASAINVGINSAVIAGTFVLGMFAGISDGLTAGMRD